MKDLLGEIMAVFADAEENLGKVQAKKPSQTNWFLTIRSLPSTLRDGEALWWCNPVTTNKGVAYGQLKHTETSSTERSSFSPSCQHVATSGRVSASFFLSASVLLSMCGQPFGIYCDIHRCDGASFLFFIFLINTDCIDPNSFVARGSHLNYCLHHKPRDGPEGVWETLILELFILRYGLPCHAVPAIADRNVRRYTPRLADTIRLFEVQATI